MPTTILASTGILGYWEDHESCGKEVLTKEQIRSPVTSMLSSLSLIMLCLFTIDINMPDAVNLEDPWQPETATK
jgi:hypothetical protein